jgi:hypothetical protein
VIGSLLSSQRLFRRHAVALHGVIPWWISATAIYGSGLCVFNMAMKNYPRHFRVVEVQRTFYDPPRDAVMQMWLQATPGLEYTMKVWQLVTHVAGSPTYRRMKQPLPDGEPRFFAMPRRCAKAGAAPWNAGGCLAPLQCYFSAERASDLHPKGRAHAIGPRLRRAPTACLL